MSIEKQTPAFCQTAVRRSFLCRIGMLAVVLSSCESQQDVQSDIERLKNERTTIQQEVQNLSSLKNSKQKEIASLNEKLKELNIYNSGKTPHYILKIRLKQSRVSLDIGKHIKDGMNAIEFELPVDKDFYNSVSVGTKITDEFRTGSFILNGSFSSWDMTVKGKVVR
jgi:seryl-tRNA synthetase